MSTLRAGIIGLGVGETHAAAYDAHPGSEVAGLCDLDGGRLADLAERYPGARSTSDARDLLDDDSIDVVSVASYDSSHYGHVTRALDAGKHVFAEKPLCRSAEEAAAISARLRERPQLVLSSNFPLRLSPRFELIRGMIAAGEFGRLYYLEGDYDYGRLWKITEGWRGDLDYYSVVLGGAVHLVDLLLWLTGGRVATVTAQGNRLATRDTKFRFDDLVVATLRFENGTLAKVSANFACVHPHFHGVKVFGTDATFVNGIPDGTLYTGPREAPQARRVDAAYPGAGEADLVHSFVDAVLGTGPPRVTAGEVLETMAVCLAVEESARSGQPVAVDGFR